MKAPDKIYLPNGNEAVQNGLYKTWFDTDEHDMPYAEYIRKEALMEWIQEARAIPHDNGIARDLTFQEIVNKLNSM